MRPSSFVRGGGGQLNKVDVTLVGYSFVANTTGYEIKNGDKKGGMFTPLNLVISLLVDGAEEAVTRRLLVGEATDYAGVSADGLTLELGDGKFSAKSEAGQFIDSLVEAGFDANEFDEDPTTINLAPVVGRRFEVIQVDVLNKDGVKKTHVGKNAQVVDTVYTDKSTRASKVYPGVATKVAGSKSVKGSKVADVAVEAGKALLAVLASKDGVVLRAKLRMVVLTALTGKTENRDAIIAHLAKDENLTAIAGVSFDDEAISLA